MSSQDSITPGTLLSLSERERKELLAKIDQEIAEIDAAKEEEPAQDANG